MSGSQGLGGTSRAGRVLGPSLDKIIKNADWRNHSELVSSAKSALDKLGSLSESSDPLADPSAAESLLSPLVAALGSAMPKVVEPALECLGRLFSLGMIRAEVDVGHVGIHGDFNSFVFGIIDSVSKTIVLREDAIELGVLRVFLSAVRSPSVLIRGDCLVYILRTCYNIYLGGVNGTNQICAKAILAQMMIIIFARVQENSMAVSFRTVSVAELLEFTDRNLNEGSSVHFVQNLVNEVVEVNETSDGVAFGSCSKIRDDGFMLYKYLCKLSIKFSSPDYSDDQILLRGKILSLELLKVIMDNANQVWLTDETFVDAMKKFLCMSLLKNSGLSAMTIFQLMCSIFKTLITKFRSVLKSELGVFFNMLILRVLENVLQPSFLQKMTVLNLLETFSQDPQMIVDIFVNYDCDVDALNIFERTINGLLKTALGPSPGSTTTMAPAQDITFRFESVKCLVRVIKSMGAWMDKQLNIGEVYPVRNSDKDNLILNNTVTGEEGAENDNELHFEANSELADVATLEQRRAYKLELQKGVSLFNKKPSKGINFLMSTKKMGSSPEDAAFFLKNTTGLNETVIGEYLGEGEEFPVRVMHAYVDSFKFDGMDFGEAIRLFLRGFWLPGEAQKIDRIMEKFAERYCKCNPNSFTSAETAYVLAYSVIMLNTDAHNCIVQEKMSKADFIRNNRGINNGKDLPEEYLGAIYDEIVRNVIKMNDESAAPQSKQTNSLNKLLGLDGIRNLVWKQTEGKPMSANGDLIKCIQEQFKPKSDKLESEYQFVADVAILRSMMDVCWGPMLAAFSMTLDQSDDKAATSQCLQGFRYAVHVTSVMGMQTQRDAFVTTVAKFTYLHCAADMKQKNIEAVKAIIAIAIEDGNDLQEAWEHILTCLSRFEHLQILGEGAPSDSSFFTASKGEANDKAMKSSNFSSLKKKGTIQNHAVAAVIRGSSYDSTTTGVNSSGLVKPEQMTNFISNLNLLDQIGNFELNHIFAQSQRLNSEAIVAFVKALCKVSMAELQSPTDPRVFSLTKLVEVAHYNMDRIRLVWSRIWSVLSDFFVAVGLSENLSVAIFVIDSLRQLAMKFLEREELVSYNFQNEFLKPFVIVMQKSSSAEIRELIVRCISQMVLSRVSNVKSGWKSVFMVFTTAASDERKNVVLLAFKTVEKLVREYFPYMTETETVTFTECVGCLISFTRSKFNSDVSLDAIAFLRFCAVKLADAGLICNENNRVVDSSVPEGNDEITGEQAFKNKDHHMFFWIPLLTGLSKLTLDSREAIRMGALEVLFNILKDHGHLFSPVFLNRILNSIVFPIYICTHESKGTEISNDNSPPATVSPPSDKSNWDSETSAVAINCLLDLFTNFFIMLRSKMPVIVSILVNYIKSSGQGPAKIGVNALKRLAGDLGDRFSTDEWEHIFLALKEAAATSLPRITNLIRTMDIIDIPEIGHPLHDVEMNYGQVSAHVDSEDENLRTAAYVVSRMKSHFAEQLLIVQVMNNLFKKHQKSLSSSNIMILIAIFSCISANAQQINSEIAFHLKLQRACSILEISELPLVSFENESFQNYLDFLHDLLSGSQSLAEELDIEPLLVSVCENVLRIYLDCCGSQAINPEPQLHWIIPLGSVKKEELAARTPLTVSSLRILSDFESFSFKRYASRLFPLFADLVRSEHSSREVQFLLCYIFQSCIGPMLLY